MIRTALASVSLAALSACTTVPADTPAQISLAQAEKRAIDGVMTDGSIPTDVRRVSIVVRDMDRSLAFYRDVVGLEVNYDAEVTLSGVALPVGEPNTRARLVLLNSNDPYVGWIGLLHLLDPPLADEPYPTRLSPGSTVIVLNTDDVPGRCAAAAKLPRVTMTSEPHLQIYPGRNGGPDIRVMGCNLLDPDGIAIEMNQLLDD
ncbi:MAG: VOC family protein [Pacificimonas sp.]|jgi:catechol 2,3-dioxygenase-like lactoylglutathione lyase family enzyme|nr:VOC family protein [Pacificimonas sp.]